MSLLSKLKKVKLTIAKKKQDDAILEAIMRDNSFAAIREDAIKFVKKEQESVIKRCLSECDLHDHFAYNYEYRTNTFTIYTCHPGIWIGLHGATIDKIKSILQEYKPGCDVSFVEIRGHFLES